MLKTQSSTSRVSKQTGMTGFSPLKRQGSQSVGVIQEEHEEDEDRPPAKYMPGDSDSELENIPCNRAEMQKDVPMMKRAKYAKFLGKGPEAVAAENERRSRIRYDRSNALVKKKREKEVQEEVK